MILTVHILTGAAIAAKTQNPILGFLFAFLSHLILDFFPHKEYSIKNIFEKSWHKSKKDFFKIAFDVIFGFLIIFIILLLKNKNLPLNLWQFFFQNQLIILGGVIAVLPDILTLLFILLPSVTPLKSFNNFHLKIHYFKNPAPNGFRESRVFVFCQIFNQILTGALAILFLL